MGICVCIHVCMHSCTQHMYRYILLKVILFIYMPIHTHKHTQNQRERLFLQQIQNWSHIISFTRTHLNKLDFLLWHLSSHIHPISSVNLKFFFGIFADIVGLQSTVWQNGNQNWEVNWNLSALQSCFVGRSHVLRQTFSVPGSSQQPWSLS